MHLTKVNSSFKQKCKSSFIGQNLNRIWSTKVSMFILLNAGLDIFFLIKSQI